MGPSSRFLILVYFLCFNLVLVLENSLEVFSLGSKNYLCYCLFALQQESLDCVLISPWIDFCGYLFLGALSEIAVCPRCYYRADFL